MRYKREGLEKRKGGHHYYASFYRVGVVECNNKEKKNIKKREDAV